MPTKLPRNLVTFTPEEKVKVKDLADRLGLSISEFLRNLALGYRLPDPSILAAADEIRDLLRVNADQARLGNLLKLALDEADGAFSPATTAHIEALIRDVRETQETIRNGVKSLHYEIHPRKRKS